MHFFSCVKFWILISILYSSCVVSFQPSRRIALTPSLITTSSKNRGRASTTSTISPQPAPQQPVRMSTEEFPPTDPSSSSSVLHMVLTKVGSTTSAVVAITFYLILAYKRDALMVSFFIGAISNGILSKVLKKLLQQERPADLDESALDLVPSDNGMPSSHAMSLGFIGTFTALILPWTTLPSLIYVIVSLVYRVKINLHTVEQILVGITLGSMNGYFWRSLCVGTNTYFPNINVIDWVSENLLNGNGELPLWALSVPALVGAAVVGSIERRISLYLKKKRPKDD